MVACGCWIERHHQNGDWKLTNGGNKYRTHVRKSCLVQTSWNSSAIENSHTRTWVTSYAHGFTVCGQPFYFFDSCNLCYAWDTAHCARQTDRQTDTHTHTVTHLTASVQDRKNITLQHIDIVVTSCKNNITFLFSLTGFEIGHSFPTAAPMIWNICLSQTLLSFQKHLNTHLFQSLY